MTLAVLSLALPVRTRTGVWLPLHLALAGGIATAISGAMENFALALTAGPGPGARIVRLRFWSLAGGVAAIGVGVPRQASWLVAIGGTAFVGSMALLGWSVWRARSRSLHHRHRAPVNAYLLAVAAVLAGGLLGALLGAGVVSPTAWAHVRRAHLTLNVLGFGSLTVAGTLLTFLPTVLRVRIPPWRAWFTVSTLAAGPMLLVLGDLLDVRTVYVAGGLVEMAGAVSLLTFAALVFRTPRAFAVPVVAMHAVAALCWFVAGAVGIAWASRRGPASFDAMREAFLVVFVAGWLVQTLLGAWGYVLPMATPGHPDTRRRQLAVFEAGGRFQLLAYNAGLVLWLGGLSGWVPSPVGVAGGALALAAGVSALAKSWGFVALARGRLGVSLRGRAVWGG